uniref:WAT1-related protein n=1 Tax=Solanum tuberosum TaxID=4113 RepID=M1C8A2_SOLTU
MSMEKQKHYIAMLLTQAIFAGMALLSKSAISQGMNPYVFVTYRQSFAIIALAPLAAFFERVEALAIKKSHGMAKLLGSSIGVTGALVFALVKGPQLNFMNWFKGNTRGTHSSNLNYSLKEEWLKGSLVMVLANITWSLWLILQVPIVKQYPAKLRLATLYCLFSWIQSSIWAMVMERNISAWKLKWDINLFSVAYCGLIVTGLTYWIQLWTVEKKGPVFISMFTPLSLIITAIVSAFLWKETLYVGSVCGGILLVGGLYLVLWGKNREAEREIVEIKDGITVI